MSEHDNGIRISTVGGRVLSAAEAEAALRATQARVPAPATAAARDAFVAAVKQTLRQLRTTRGLTQGALADAIGVSTSTISRLESAGTPVDLGMLCEIMQALGAGLRCELDLDAPVLAVAIRPQAAAPAAAVEPSAAGGGEAELAALRERIAGIERWLAGGPGSRRGRVPRPGAIGFAEVFRAAGGGGGDDLQAATDRLRQLQAAQAELGHALGRLRSELAAVARRQEAG